MFNAESEILILLCCKFNAAMRVQLIFNLTLGNLLSVKQMLGTNNLCHWTFSNFLSSFRSKHILWFKTAKHASVFLRLFFVFTNGVVTETLNVLCKQMQWTPLATLRSGIAEKYTYQHALLDLFGHLLLRWKVSSQIYTFKMMWLVITFIIVMMLCGFIRVCVDDEDCASAGN